MSEHLMPERLAEIRDLAKRFAWPALQDALAEIDVLTQERNAYLNDLRISNDTGHTFANRVLVESQKVANLQEVVASMTERLRRKKGC